MKLTIIIPVYNKIRYIAGLLEQLREQTFSDYECLLIDDGSTDGSGAICDEFAALDARFRVFHIPNGGVSRARNMGLDHAGGEYITFIDADDGILRNYLENLVRRLEASDAEMVISGYKKVNAAGVVLHTITPCQTGVWQMPVLLPDFARTQLETGLYGCCVAKIFPRKLAQNIRFDESVKLAEDFDFYLNLYEIIQTVYLDDYTGYLYLQEAENSTGNIPSEKIDYLAQLRIYRHYRSVLEKRNTYNGENRKIVEGRLWDYAFFVLFHTPLACYRERFDCLYDLYRSENITLWGNTLLRKWLFFCLSRHLCLVARSTMACYRAARRIRNGVK